MCLRIDSPAISRVGSGGLSSLVGIDRPKPILKEAPVDRPAKLGQRVVHVDDLIEPRPEEIVLTAVPPLPRPHRITLRRADGGRESQPNAPFNFARKQAYSRRFPANAMTRRSSKTPQKSGTSGFFTEDAGTRRSATTGAPARASTPSSSRAQ